MDEHTDESKRIEARGLADPRDVGPTLRGEISPSTSTVAGDVPQADAHSARKDGPSESEPKAEGRQHPPGPEELMGERPLQFRKE